MGGDSVVSVAGSSLSASDTDDLSEGSTNLYFTNARLEVLYQLLTVVEMDHLHTTLLQEL